MFSILGGRPRQVDPRLIVRLCDQLCCCLPVSVRRTMWCGVDQEPAPTQELRDIQVKLHFISKSQRSSSLNIIKGYANKISYMEIRNREFTESFIKCHTGS